EAARVRRPVTGCGDRTLTGHARDFAALVEAGEPFIQPDELIVGACLAVPEDGGGLQLGEYDPHYPPGYAVLLRKGLPGIRDEAHRRLQGELDPQKRDFLGGVAVAYDAACRYVERYGRYAEDLAVLEADASRASELLGIAATCRALAAGPPATFRAGLQLLQFTRALGGYGCIGRFDQWLYPLYRGDVDAGRLSQEEAQELLECLFVKLNHFAGTGPATPRAGVGNDTLRNIALAGQTPDGRDACNELTYMCLQASGRLMLPEPKLNVRFFAGSPPRLVRACCQVLAKGANTLAVFNDEVAVPALERQGIPLEEARDYCNDGCSELIMGGKGTIRFQVHDALPVLTALALEAEDGRYATFDEVMAQFQARVADFIPPDHGEPRPITHPFFAATIEDCLAEASPAAARYAINGTILAQVGNAADGLAAIRKHVCEEGTLTWPELARALRDGFDGHEPLRQLLRNRSAKYGNDDDYVDGIVREIAEGFCDQVHGRARNPRGPGPKRAPGFMAFGIHHKSDTPASPDGRRRGEPTANSFSPAVGMDRSGPTAALRSAAKVDLTRASHGSVLDLALHSSLVRGDGHFEKFVALLAAFLEMRSVATLQLNVVDRDTLLRAQANPEAPEFRTLIVRVWGFSAVFVELPEGLQEHVVARTHHGATA
ncbi:MAG: pyruvate formate lyase family protein, partial [Gemmatimonadota bacterium]